MKQGYRFVDCDMHVMEPDNIFERFLDPAFASRVTTPMHLDGGGKAFTQRWLIDGKPNDADHVLLQYDKSYEPLAAALENPDVLFALDAGYDAPSFIKGMDIEGVDIAVLFPSAGLNFIARPDLDPLLSNAIARAYNDWLYDFCSHSPDRLKPACMLPVHDVNLACQELVRAVRELGAVGAYVRPNPLPGKYWHSKHWDPLFSLLEELDVPFCFHEGTGSHLAAVEQRFGSNRFMRHVASHPTEMQLALIAMMIGGVFEFHPKLNVAFLEAQSWWVPGVLDRMTWDLQHHRAHVPFLKMSFLEYWQRNCYSSIEGTERDVGAVVDLVGADHLCVTTDFPHFDSNFPNVSNAVLANSSITPEIGGRILSGGGRLYGFGEEHFEKSDAALPDWSKVNEVEGAG